MFIVRRPDVHILDGEELEMRASIPWLVVLLVGVSLCIPDEGEACVWDREFEAIMVHHTEFPSALELISGRFPQHSDRFYRWRIQDRQKRLEEHPHDLSAFDDIAVSYEHLGHTHRALQWMERKRRVLEDTSDLSERERSQARYRYHANLGTFYIHDHEFETGLTHIEQALEINPDAHFGREQYQKLLVEYVIEAGGPGSRPLNIKSLEMEAQSGGFHTYIAKKLGTRRSTECTYSNGADCIRYTLDESTRWEAIRGVLGMIRFGSARSRSPILLEALGDLFRNVQSDPNSGKRLAAQAYMMAAAVTRGGGGIHKPQQTAQARVQGIRQFFPEVDSPFDRENNAVKGLVTYGDGTAEVEVSASERVADELESQARDAIDEIELSWTIAGISIPYLTDIFAANSIEELKGRLAHHQAQGEDLHERIAQHEAKWIEGSVDPEVRYREKYLEATWSEWFGLDHVETHLVTAGALALAYVNAGFRSLLQNGLQDGLGFVWVIVFFCAIVFMIIWMYRRRADA